MERAEHTLFSRLLSRPDRLALAVVAGGIAARLYLFFLNRSFWTDEAKLALNVINRSFAGLLRPLEFDQAAPPGFLLLSKLMTVVLGDSDLVLRMVPLIAGCAVLYLMYRVAFRLLPPLYALLALVVFALGKYTLYFATDFKQYAPELAVALGLSLLVLDILSGGATLRRLAVVCAAGLVATVFSYSAVFVLGGATAALLIDALRRGDRRMGIAVLGIAAAWGVTFFVLLIAMSGPVSSSTFLQDYWKFAFLNPGDPFWIPFHTADLFVNPGGLLDGGIVVRVAYLLLGGVGAVSLVRSRPAVAVLLFLPLVLALGASALQRYPFADRLMLWSIPALVLALVEGLRVSMALFRSRVAIWRLANAALILLLLAGPLRAAAGDMLRPKARQHIKPLLAQLVARRSAGDLLYVHYRSRNPFLYYYPRYGIADSEFVVSSDFQYDPDRYAEEIRMKARGGRTWLLFAPLREDGRVLREKIVARLGKWGTITEEGSSSGASLHLFRPSRTVATMPLR